MTAPPPILARPDRLSSLIRRFHVLARVRKDAEAEEPANLFIFRAADPTWLDPDLSGHAGDLPLLVHYPRGGPTVPTLPANGDPIRAWVDTGGAANPLARALPDRIFLPLRQVPELAAVTELLIQESEAPRCGGGAVIDRLCEVLVIRLLRHVIETGLAEPGLVAGLGDGHLSRALVAIHDQPEHGWRLEDLAALAGLSRTHFANRFRQVLGVTPGDYLTGWRLSLARTALHRGESLKSVAGQVGFSGPAALSRAYRRYFGVPPREDLAPAK